MQTAGCNPSGHDCRWRGRGIFRGDRLRRGNPEAQVTLYELTAQPLAKVRISGGGRRNATTAFTEPVDLVAALSARRSRVARAVPSLGSAETVAWFAEHGVELKAEADGRMFPVTDDAGTVVACLQRAAAEAGVNVRTRCGVAGGAPGFFGGTHHGRICDLRPAPDRDGRRKGRGRTGAGSAARPHHCSAGAFVVHVSTDGSPLTGLSGLAAEHAEVGVPGTKLQERGPLLITHWGLSGPAILKLSAWGARLLHDRDYRFDLTVNWVAPRGIDEALAELVRLRTEHPRRQMAGGNSFGLPQRLWERLASAAGAEPSQPWTSVSNEVLKAFARELGEGKISVIGKSQFKEEFVTCGGVRLDEVRFQTMESRRCPDPISPARSSTSTD